MDITHIIRHDFSNFQDFDASLEFVKNTIETLKKNLHLYGTDDFFEFREYDGEITFSLPIYDVELTLHNGFWQMESFYHYCQIVMHHGDYFGLRRKTFDIVRALGKTEAWYAEERYTWNGGNIEDPKVAFEEWIIFAENKYKKSIPEYDQEAIVKQGDVHIPDYEPLYHDSFKECLELFEAEQSRLGEYKLLGLTFIGKGYYRCVKEGGLFLIDSETLNSLFDEPVEAILQSLNGPEFIVLKNGLSAVFDMNGNQLTDYVKGKFDWKWGKLDSSSPNNRIIYNKEADIELSVP